MNQLIHSICRSAGLGVVLTGAAFAVHAETLNFSGYPGTIGANMNKAFIETFDKGTTVKYVESWDSARFTRMQANRAHPKEDVVTFTDLTLPLVAAAGLLDPLNAKEIPELADIDPAVLAKGNTGVAYGYGCQGILYNAKYVKKPITSWSDLLRDDLKGHVSAPNVAYSMVFNVLDALARTQGGSIENPQKGMELYRQIRTSGPGLWDSENIAVGWLKTGEIWVTPYHSGNALTLATDPDLKDLRFVAPKEGAYYAPLLLAKVKNGPDGGKVADKFINHALSVPSQEMYAQLNHLRPANTKAKVPADAEAACPTASKLNKIDVDYMNQNRSKIIDQWNQVVNR